MIRFEEHEGKLFRMLEEREIMPLFEIIGTQGEKIISWQIYKEPELKYKVGDWVDCKDPVGVPTQCKVLEILEHNVIVECKTGHRWSLPHNNITSKLSPADIVIRIGCLSGRVERHDGNPTYWFKLRSSKYNYALISIEMLDKETRELVDGLLKAQEEE